MRGRPRVDWRVLFSLCWRPENRRESCFDIAGEPQMRIGIARHETEVEMIGDVESQLGRACDIVIVVVVAPLARRQQIERRYRRVARMQDARHSPRSETRPPNH